MNTLERLLTILEFKHFIEKQTPRKGMKNFEFTVSVAVNIAGLNISKE